MSKEYFASTIYDKSLFDIPKIMDLCVLYGSCNKQLVRKIILSLFDLQPKYVRDLESVVPSIVQAMEDCKQRLCEGKENARILADTFHFLLDLLATVSAFLTVYPESSSYYQVALQLGLLIWKASGLLQKLPSLYSIAQLQISGVDVSVLMDQLKACVLSIANRSDCFFFFWLKPVCLKHWWMLRERNQLKWTNSSTPWMILLWPQKVAKSPANSLKTWGNSITCSLGWMIWSIISKPFIQKANHNGWRKSWARCPLYAVLIKHQSEKLNQCQLWLVKFLSDSLCRKAHIRPPFPKWSRCSLTWEKDSSRPA